MKELKAFMDKILPTTDKEIFEKRLTNCVSNIKRLGKIPNVCIFVENATGVLSIHEYEIIKCYLESITGVNTVYGYEATSDFIESINEAKIRQKSVHRFENCNIICLIRGGRTDCAKDCALLWGGIV